LIEVSHYFIEIALFHGGIERFDKSLGFRLCDRSGRSVRDAPHDEDCGYDSYPFSKGFHET
jgi:hypothetical protein